MSQVPNCESDYRYILLSYTINSDEEYEWFFNGVYQDKQAAETERVNVVSDRSDIYTKILRSKIGENPAVDLGYEVYMDSKFIR